MAMNRISLALGLAGLVCFSAPIEASQTQSAAAPKELERAIKQEFSQPGMPGCAYGVVRNGKLIISGEYGLADVENGVSIDASTRFDIGSMSKQFLAMAVLLLAKEGKLSLDDDVH